MIKQPFKAVSIHPPRAIYRPRRGIPAFSGMTRMVSVGPFTKPSTFGTLIFGGRLRLMGAFFEWCFDKLQIYIDDFGPFSYTYKVGFE